MASRRDVRPNKTVTGYFLASDPSVGNSNNESDDDSTGSSAGEEDILDFGYSDVFTSISVSSGSSKYQTLNFMENKTPVKCQISGRFSFFDPWWCLTMTVRPATRPGLFLLVGSPQYSIRCDDHVANDKVVLLWMRSCNVDACHSELFYKFLCENGEQHNLTFELLEDLLNKFGNSSEENCKIATMMKKFMESDMLMKDAMAYKSVFLHLPTLLPKKFKFLSSLDEERLSDMEDALNNEPWVFAFSSVMMRLFRLSSVEATFKCFNSSELFDKLEPKIRDAIYIYSKLSDLCQYFGDTYKSFSKLKSKYKLDDHFKYRRIHEFPNYNVTNWEESLSFLEEQDVIVREVEKDRIYLKKYYDAEKNIAKGLNRLIEDHKSLGFTIEIDENSPYFEKIKNDEDQLLAAHSIGQKAVLVLTGRGGCGKTEVVAKVFAYYLNVLRARRAEVNRMFENHEEICDMDLVGFANGNRDAIGEIKISDEEINMEKVRNPADSVNATSSNCPGKEKTKNDVLLSNEILLTAPTGKAANLLGHRSGLISKTLHQVLYSFNNWVNNKFEKNVGEPWSFANVRVLVVDECSLVSVTLFSRLLHTLQSNSRLAKVILLGDIHQLPSIEPGRFFSDLFESLDRIGCSITLKTNHRTESQTIVDNAGLILKKQVPIHNPERHFHMVELDEDDQSIANARDMAVRKLLDDGLLPDQKNSQFIALRRSDCDGINEICCKHYVNHSMYKMNKKGKKRPDFRVGDKVCCTRNGQVELCSIDKKDKRRPDSRVGDKVCCTGSGQVDLCSVEDEKDGADAPEVKDGRNDAEGDNLPKKKTKVDAIEKRRLCNGEIFFIKGMRQVFEGTSKRRSVVTYVALENDRGQVITVALHELINICKLKHAWARTIHTFQGSESDSIVYFSGSIMETWQHAYTAVTRGKMNVWIVAQPSQIRYAISRDPLERLSSLKERFVALLKVNENKQPPDFRALDGCCHTSVPGCSNLGKFPHNSSASISAVTESDQCNPQQEECPQNEVSFRTSQVCIPTPLNSDSSCHQSSHEPEENITDDMFPQTSQVLIQDWMSPQTYQILIQDWISPQTSQIHMHDGMSPQTSQVHIQDGMSPQTSRVHIQDGMSPQTSRVHIQDGMSPQTPQVHIQDGISPQTSQFHIQDGISPQTSQFHILDGISPQSSRMRTPDARSPQAPLGCLSTPLKSDSPKRTSPFPGRDSSAKKRLLDDMAPSRPSFESPIKNGISKLNLSQQEN